MAEGSQQQIHTHPTPQDLFVSTVRFAVVLHFELDNLQETVTLPYEAPVEAPRRNEVVVFSFVDNSGKVRRFSAVVRYAQHEFFEGGTVASTTAATYVLHLHLHGLAEQPTAVH